MDTKSVSSYELYIYYKLNSYFMVTSLSITLKNFVFPFKNGKYLKEMKILSGYYRPSAKTKYILFFTISGTSFFNNYPSVWEVFLFVFLMWSVSFWDFRATNWYITYVQKSPATSFLKTTNGVYSKKLLFFFLFFLNLKMLETCIHLILIHTSKSSKDLSTLDM